MIFVGERRSKLAVKMGVRWEDGRLAAKQLFDALRENGIDPTEHFFINAFEPGSRGVIERMPAELVVGMGRKVQDWLDGHGIEHLKLIHPAARGKIRSKARYAAHVKKVLK